MLWRDLHTQIVSNMLTVSCQISSSSSSSFYAHVPASASASASSPVSFQSGQYTVGIKEGKKSNRGLGKAARENQASALAETEEKCPLCVSAREEPSVRERSVADSGRSCPTMAARVPFD